MWTTLGLAFALMLVLEGVLPLVAPASWRQMFSRVTELNDGQIRFFGLIAVAGGLDKEAGRAIVHGMPTADWKALHHTAATPEMGRIGVLVELAEQAGLPRIEFADVFDRAEQHTATAADFTWVQDLGIAGFPTLLAERNGQLALLTNGYQPLSELSPLLGRWLERAACV